MAATSCSALLAGIGAAPASAAPNAAGRVTVNGTWRTAKEVPGLAALNKGGNALVSSVSCSSAGNCGAAGLYTDGATRGQLFVVNQTNGTWGKAIEVPGIEALNVGGIAEFITLSCASPGNCSAGGEYSFRTGGFNQAFVVSEKNGTWGKAIEVPGMAALNAQGDAEVTALSCASPGNCSAAGHYGDSHGRQAFVVNQTNGTWGKAIQIPGTRFRAVEFADVSSVSCPAPGDCTAGGTTSHDGIAVPFVVSERNGTWHKAIEVPGIEALDVGEAGGVSSLSCAAVGDCSAGGSYQDRAGFAQAFVVSEKNGTWHKAIEVPGTAALNQQNAGVAALSCASPGNCSASGTYAEKSLFRQPFVVTERNGTWGKAIEVPGIAALNREDAGFITLSCGSPGNCSVGGSYVDRHLAGQAFVANQVHGTWAKAIEVPGTAALNTGGEAGMESVSCASPGRCSAGGFYGDSHGNLQGFVVSET